MCKCLWGTADKLIRINRSGSCLVMMCQGQMEGCLVPRGHSEPWLGTHCIQLTFHSVTQELNDIGPFMKLSEPQFPHLKNEAEDSFLVKLCVDSTKWWLRLPQAVWVPWWIVFSWKMSLSCHVKHRTTHEVSGLKKKFGFFLKAKSSLKSTHSKHCNGQTNGIKYKETVRYLEGWGVNILKDKRLIAAVDWWRETWASWDGLWSSCCLPTYST